MRKFGVCLALAGATVWLTGCGMQFGSSSSSRGGIAVVDLDKVAAETGKKMEMDDAFATTTNAVSQKFNQLTNEASATIQEEVKKAGEDATDEEKQKIAQMTLNARNNLTAIKNKAGAELNQYKQIQIAKFRNELKPILQDCATKRGLAVVIPKNDGLLLAVDPGVDITDDVIKAYREKKPAPTAAAAAPAAPAKSAEKSSETAAKAAPAAKRDTAKATDDSKL